MQATAEQDNLSAKDRKMQAFKQEVQNAKQRGLEILPGVNGPYAFNPDTDRVVGVKGSKEYADATAEINGQHEEPSFGSPGC